MTLKTKKLKNVYFRIREGRKYLECMKYPKTVVRKKQVSKDFLNYLR